MTNPSTLESFESIATADLPDVCGGLRLEHIAGQALNGAILGGTAGAVGGFVAGAFAGSIAPGLGTVGGAAAGTVIGGINGATLGAVHLGVQEFKRQRREGDVTP
jgi:hypothetical protein